MNDLLDIQITTDLNQLTISDIFLSEKALDKIASAVQEQIKSKAPVVTGRLRDSIKIASKKDLRSIYTEISYAPYVNFGTPPHKIYAKRGKSLRYIMDGIIKFSKSVNHPGSKANPYFLAANGEANQDTKDLIQKVIDDLPAEEFIQFNKK